MKRILIISCWIGLASYCLLASTIGPTGLVAIMEAQAAAERMQRNLTVLSSLNAGYAAEWEGLRTRPEATVLEARSLGYLADDEVAVRLALTQERSDPPSPGTRLSYEPAIMISEPRIKQLAGIAALVAVIVGLALRLKPWHGLKHRQREILAHAAART